MPQLRPDTAKQIQKTNKQKTYIREKVEEHTPDRGDCCYKVKLLHLLHTPPQPTFCNHQPVPWIEDLGALLFILFIYFLRCHM